MERAGAVPLTTAAVVAVAGAVVVGAARGGAPLDAAGAAAAKEVAPPIRQPEVRAAAGTSPIFHLLCYLCS